MSGVLQGKTVALIGGAGFIGHHLALHLAKHGARVEVVDGLQVNNLLWLTSSAEKFENRDLYLAMVNERLQLLQQKKILLHAQDARDYHALSRVLAHIKPDVIVHLAAISHAGKSNKDPFSTFDHSLRTLENALDYARLGVKQFIFFSSSMVYGNFRSESVDENHPLDPIGIYGNLKLAGERIVLAYNQVFNLPFTILRPSALYGPRCVSRRVIQIFIENALAGKPLKMEGGGAEQLDFTYIDDLTEGVFSAIAKPAALNQTFNMTFGKARPLSVVVDLLKEHFPKLKVESAPKDQLMPTRGTLAIDKATELLGYKPKFPLEKGVPQYIDWYESFYKTLK